MEVFRKGPLAIRRTQRRFPPKLLKTLFRLSRVMIFRPLEMLSNRRYKICLNVEFPILNKINDYI